jgi:hypothetical protein
MDFSTLTPAQQARALALFWADEAQRLAAAAPAPAPPEPVAEVPVLPLAEAPAARAPRAKPRHFPSWVEKMTADGKLSSGSVFRVTTHGVSCYFTLERMNAKWRLVNQALELFGELGHGLGVHLGSACQHLVGEFLRGNLLTHLVIDRHFFRTWALWCHLGRHAHLWVFHSIFLTPWQAGKSVEIVSCQGATGLGLGSGAMKFTAMTLAGIPGCGGVAAVVPMVTLTLSAPQYISTYSPTPRSMLNCHEMIVSVPEPETVYSFVEYPTGVPLRTIQTHTVFKLELVLVTALEYWKLYTPPTATVIFVSSTTEMALPR